jgi:hypothetical protein
MPLKRTLTTSLLLTILIWLVFSWPLPRHAAEGIPSSAHNIERQGVRTMIVGDHLQFHYFFWLFSDMLAGQTPMFENRYEFNTGNDAERYKPGSYNMPLSFVYAAVRPLAGRAFAWNTVLFLSLWLTLLWTCLSLRGLLPSRRLTLLAAAAAIAFPYRWVMLFGGSPTGLAMMWLALLAFGISLAFREDKPLGGLWAALALTAAYFNDRHVFFFAFIAAPFLCLLFLMLREEIPWSRRSFRKTLLLGALPLLVAGLLLGALAARTALGGFAETSLEGGRTIEEVRKYAPYASGLVSWGGRGRDAHAYLGWGFFVLAALFLASAFRGWRNHDAHQRRLTLAGLLLWLASFGVILMALGPNGPFDGALFDLFRAHVPGSKALRQPAKIFALFTLLLPAALAVSFAHFKTVGRLGLAALLTVLMLGDFALQIHPSICLLDTEQPAYAAVAADADKDGQPARIVILPLWPGDSDWAAVYQHYVSLYRIRMLNGYRPVVPNTYRDLVRQFFSLNSGLLSDAQADALLSRGFHHLILHEDAFPEKVSPFPVVFTRNRLLTHPRLELLHHAETVWAFKILPAPRAWIPAARPGPLFPARLWEFERAPSTNVVVKTDSNACNGAYAVIRGDGAITGRTFKVFAMATPALLLRLRGEGDLMITPSAREAPRLAAAVRTNAWTWFRVPLDPAREADLQPVFTAGSGSIDADIALLTSGDWPPPQPGRPVTIPAEFFFHAGWSDPVTGAVHLRPDYEPDDYIFYGPRLPMGPGRLRIDLDLTTQAKSGTPLGRVMVETMGEEWGPFPVTAGKPFHCVVTPSTDRPLSLRFQYRRRAPVVIRSATFTLLERAD